MFTFDTNALIYYLAGKESIIDFIEQNKDALYFIPTVVIVEFLSFKELRYKNIGAFRKIFERFNNHQS
jgi:predicted nucleic acid-binding protein